MNFVDWIVAMEYLVKTNEVKTNDVLLVKLAKEFLAESLTFQYNSSSST